MSALDAVVNVGLVVLVIVSVVAVCTAVWGSRSVRYMPRHRRPS